MKMHTQLMAKDPPESFFTLGRVGLIQRKQCEMYELDENCSKCRKEIPNMQCSSTEIVEPSSVPPVVNEVLNSPGESLDKETRVFMESRFGHDFSKIRVHTNSKAAESAKAVNALAYTVGKDVVFGAERYSPRTSEGKKLLAHELVHIVQQGNQEKPQKKLAVGKQDDVFEKEADNIASRVLEGQPFTKNVSPVQQMIGFIQRDAIHRGNILDEGNCTHLACNSKYACKDNANGITCPEGTRNASKTGKYRPLFTCDTKCENNKTCSDSDNWMAIPKSLFARSKCSQDLVICANGKSTHAYVRDRSHIEAYEVSRGIQDRLGVSPYATFIGSIYGDEKDPEFFKDTRCQTVESPDKKEIEKPQSESENESPSKKPNGKSTHAYVRDRSHIEAYEVSRGIQDRLGVSPYATFIGSIYGDEKDPEFFKDTRCQTVESPDKKEIEKPQSESENESPSKKRAKAAEEIVAKLKAAGAKYKQEEGARDWNNYALSDCSKFVQWTLETSDEEKIFGREKATTSLMQETIKKLTEKEQVAFRKTNPEVGDIMMWEKHVAIVTEVVELKGTKLLVYANMGSHGAKLIGKDGSTGKENYWLKADDIAKIEKMGDGAFLGFWTPP